jgi:trans-2-enoyl-CoA reductase
MYNLKGLLLVEGSCYRTSTGFGLASRISSALDLMLQQLVSSKKPTEGRTASGWYIQLLSKKKQKKAGYAKW